MPSRNDDIKEIASLMGNAAAHRAVYGEDAFTIHEAYVYEGKANKLAEMRNWNNEEIDRLAQRTKREARNIMKQRTEDWRGQSYELLCFLADREIDKFIQKARQRKKKNRARK